MAKSRPSSMPKFEPGTGHYAVQQRVRAVHLRLGKSLPKDVVERLLSQIEVEIKEVDGGLGYELRTPWAAMSGWVRDISTQELHQRLIEEAFRLYKADWF